MNGPEFKSSDMSESARPPATSQEAPTTGGTASAPSSDALANSASETPHAASEAVEGLADAPAASPAAAARRAQRHREDLPEAPDATDDPVIARATRILSNLGFCGHYLHFHRGGRSGRAPILCLLEKNGGTLSQQELGLFFELKPGSLSEILSKMEAAGLISRARDHQDRRQLKVTLTEAGAAAARMETEIRQRFRSSAFSNLTPEEQETLADLLDRVRNRWEEIDG